MVRRGSLFLMPVRQCAPHGDVVLWPYGNLFQWSLLGLDVFNLQRVQQPLAAVTCTTDQQISVNILFAGSDSASRRWCVWYCLHANVDAR